LDWLSIILNFYGITKLTLDLVKNFRSVYRRIAGDEWIVSEIKENLLSGELQFGNKIKIVGTFSEYVPFINPSTFTNKFEISSSPRTSRIGTIENYCCGAIYLPDEKMAASDKVLPIFYDESSPIRNNYTGQVLEIKGIITPIPFCYIKIIQHKDSFSMTKPDGTDLAFGLRVENVKLHSQVDEFYINTWILGNLTPFSKRKISEKLCESCTHSFVYATLEPFSMPKLGCRVRSHDATKEILKATDEFFKIDESGKSYVNFIKPYSLFEIRNPKINILDNEILQYSRHLLYKTISENLRSILITGAPVFWLIPEAPIIKRPNNNVIIDYEYDQMSPIQTQAFKKELLDKIPSWKCPHYAPKRRKKKHNAKLKSTKK